MAREIIDSPSAWVAEHIREYVSSNGENGHLWRGVPTLLLTTTGRKSGDLRRCALIYGVDGDDHIIVASRGGDVNHPLWYLNLVADANVTVQVGADVFDAVATSLDGGPEYDRLWKVMTAIWPAYDEYQAKTDRKIPIVRLKRA
jgi:deazaflavin-dependent oxidoreductase (nitroreductase family)